MTSVDAFNAFEILLWLALATVCCLRSRHRDRLRRHFQAAALLLVVFALSDAGELRTGAWWRPWWLLAAKGLCLVGLLAVLAHARKSAK